MTSRFPLLETLLASLAAGSLATLWLLPATPWLAPTLRPSALGLSLTWLLWGLWRLDRCVGQWHRWRVSPDWEIAPQTLAHRTTALLGKGFRWQAPHVEMLERALLVEGALPEGRGARGGYPALHAVGHAEEDDVTLSWEDMKRHTGLIGTTGSGKTKELESLVAQAIGADYAG